MTPAVLLAVLLPVMGHAAEPAPFADDIRKLEGQQVELKGKLDERLALLSKADAKPTPANAEASRLLSKAAADTRRSLAVVASSLRKLREFGGMLAELRLKPKAVFGTSWVQGDVTLVTAGASRPLTAGMTLEERGIIITGDGRANIILPDGTRLTLAPNTRFDTSNWTLHSGELYYESLLKMARAELMRKAKKFEVRTTGGVLAVRGTRFLLTPQAVVLFDGEVEVSTTTAAAAPAYPGATPGGLSAAVAPDGVLEYSQSGRPAAFLRRGSARLRARAASAPVQVLVPNGVAAASSADWTLKVLPSGAAELSVQAGSVTMTAHENRIDAGALDRWWDAPYDAPDEEP